MKLNKFLQKIFKKFFQTLFRFFNGKIILNKNLDDLNLSVVNCKEFSKNKILVISLFKYLKLFFIKEKSI